MTKTQEQIDRAEAMFKKREEKKATDAVVWAEVAAQAVAADQKTSRLKTARLARDEAQAAAEKADAEAKAAKKRKKA
jgi:hypothetical protein